MDANQPIDTNDDAHDPASADSGAAGDPAAALQQELAELRDRYARALAEQENSRKRHQREMQESRHYAIAQFAKDLLEVVDNFSRALEALPADQTGNPYVAGVRMVQDQLSKAMSAHGVTRIEAIGQPFDAMFHSAILEEERADVPAGTVVEELVSGYRIGDRLLRAAMVKLARAPAGGAARAASDNAPTHLE